MAYWHSPAQVLSAGSRHEWSTSGSSIPFPLPVRRRTLCKPAHGTELADLPLRLLLSAAAMHPMLITREHAVYDDQNDVFGISPGA